MIDLILAVLAFFVATLIVVFAVRKTIDAFYLSGKRKGLVLTWWALVSLIGVIVWIVAFTKSPTPIPEFNVMATFTGSIIGFISGDSLYQLIG